MISDKEIKKVMRYRKKLRNYNNTLFSLAIKSPDKEVRESLRKTEMLLNDKISSLNTCVLLKTQLETGD